jgi:hypothetical protein
MHYATQEECELGPVIPEIRSLPLLATVDGLSACLVDASVPKRVRFKIAHVAMVAQRSMPSHKVGYDGTVTEVDQRLYILAKTERVVAFVLTAFDSTFWRLTWSDNGAIKLVEDKPLSMRGPKIGRVWVASECRRIGLATQLVGLAAQHLDAELLELGLELPFTQEGATFVRRLFPGPFLGCCDRFTLQQVVGRLATHIAT